MIYNKKYGMRTSGLLFLFWLFLALCGAVQYRSLINGPSEDVSNFEQIKFHSHRQDILFKLILVIFSEHDNTVRLRVLHDLLSGRLGHIFIAVFRRSRTKVFGICPSECRDDIKTLKELACHEYCRFQVERPCPETNSSFPSKILFAWFDPLAWRGFIKPLETDDLWSMNPEDTSSEIVPQFDKYWMKTLRKTDKYVVCLLA